MFPEQTTYPQFAANQVLSNKHLNDLFKYLDEQDRLTRTHLIGLGIVCGLEASYGRGENNFGISISRGCGVTSEGYLIRWDEDEVLEYFKPYEKPLALDYTFFDLPGGEGTYPMWELMVADDDDPATRGLSADFLTGTDQREGEGDEKVLILIFECELLDNKNCTPNNCDDKGETITTNVRPVLIRKNDLEYIRQVLQREVPEVAAYYALNADRASRLSLPTLRGPRFDVLNSQPVSTRDVYEAYRKMLSAEWLSAVQASLNEAYAALSPLLPGYPSNPFSTRISSMSFLHDGRMLEGPEALAYQYYYDHLMTILQAYEELRLKAEELFSLCCPDGRIFPRHLVLHHFEEDGIFNDLRHHWISSPVQNQQSDIRDALLQYFDRLVLLVGGTELPRPAAPARNFALAGNLTFAASTGRRLRAEASALRVEKSGTISRVARGKNLSKQPEITMATGAKAYVRNNLSSFEKVFTLLESNGFKFGNEQVRANSIRIIPSFLGKPLSQKALPYYYDPTDLLATWNHQLTRRGRETENLGYDAIDWNNTDDFVRQPLRYDLEPYNFLRIEGAVGQPYQPVLRELQRQVSTYRLPIDVVGIRTGSLTDDIVIDDYQIQFADLESDYCQWRERFLGRLAELAARLYDIERLDNQENVNSLYRVAAPQAALLQRLDNYRYARDTLGEFYEDHFGQNQGESPHTQGLGFAYTIPMVLLHLILRTEAAFAPSLRQLNYALAQGGLTSLQALTRNFSSQLNNYMNEALPGDPPSNRFIDVKEFQDQMDHFTLSGELAELRKIYAQYNERREEILKRQLLRGFQQDHPGLQFKAGTEPGGTFVVLYHGSVAEDSDTRQGRFLLNGFVRASNEPVSGARIQVEGTSFSATTLNNGFFRMYTTILPSRLIITDGDREPYSYWVSNDEGILNIDLDLAIPQDDAQPIPGISAGTVIADFYLPYRCCGKGAPVHIFPPAPEEEPIPPLTATTEQVTCTQGEEFGINADFRFSISGGTPPYKLIDPAGNEQDVADGQEINIPLGGDYEIRDSEEQDQRQKQSLSITLADKLSVRVESSNCAKDNSFVVHTFSVSGGKPPYSYSYVSFGDRQERTFTLQAGERGEVLVPVNEAFPLAILDEFGEKCALQHTFPATQCNTIEPGKDCDLPCDGKAVSREHILWLQEPNQDGQVSLINFRFSWEKVSVDDQALNETQIILLNKAIAEKISGAGILRITSNNFNEMNAIILEQTERATSEALNPELGLPADEPALVFSRDEVDSIRTVRIEHFACHSFSLVGEYTALPVIDGQETKELRSAFEYNPDFDIINGLRRDTFEPAARDRCENDLPLTLLATGEKPKGNFTAKKVAGGRLFALDAEASKKAVSWSFPPGVELEETDRGLVAKFPEGMKSADVRLVIIDPKTGASRIRKRTYKL